MRKYAFQKSPLKTRAKSLQRRIGGNDAGAKEWWDSLKKKLSDHTDRERCSYEEEKSLQNPHINRNSKTQTISIAMQIVYSHLYVYITCKYEIHLFVLS